MSKEPRQNLTKPQLLTEDSKKIGDRSVPTLRITISLTESTKSNCPEINFIELSTSKQVCFHIIQILFFCSKV